ncbi:MAG: hypothetical protein COZ67_05365 [Chloroflexi bacterium CG_4_8_14_3_um_filter_45_15]|nr:MAG: hypothetical protein COZ67_05365 [Chloroflexi bacterium CG_4_8_14_3_um_filter_45_15]
MKIKRCLLIMAMAIMLLATSCKAPNHPPLITSLRAEREVIASSESYQIECIASDEDGDELSYEWSSSDARIKGDGPVFTWDAANFGGNYTITVKVLDGNGGIATDSITITVRTNHPPTIITLVAHRDQVSPSDTYQIKCDAEDPDGDELRYEWSASGGNISGPGPLVTWTAPEASGTYSIKVKVIDDLGGESTRSLDINVTLNNPPIVEGLIVTPKEPKYLKEYPGGYQILLGRSCEIECIASDLDGDELSYEWSTDGNVFGEDSIVTWAAPLKEGGTVTVAVTVSDSSGGVATKSILFKVETCACAFG